MTQVWEEPQCSNGDGKVLYVGVAPTHSNKPL